MNKNNQKIKELKEILLLTNQYGGDMFYPPAVLWKKNISVKSAKKAWQKAVINIASGKSLVDRPGLYIHIPFCQTKCFYCNCVSVSAVEEEIHSEYLDCVEKEIKALDIPRGLKIKTFCAGGGTPSILSEKNLERMLKMTRRFFDFSESEQAMTEVSPLTISPSKIKILKDFGINKITLGVQTLDQKLLSRMNRKQSKKRVLLAFEQLRKGGIKYINIDLMAGLPGQTIDSFLATLKEILRLKPDTIHINPFTPLFFTPFALAGNKLIRENLFQREEMVKQGFEMIRRIYPFALEREGLEKENQQLFYTANLNSSVLGLGWGALSHVFSLLQYSKDDFQQNYKNINKGLKKYMKTLKQGGFPQFFGCALNQEDEMRAYLLRALEANGLVSQINFQNIFQTNPLDVFSKEFGELEKMGVLEKRDGELKLIAKTRFDFFVFSRVFFDKKARAKMKGIFKKRKIDLQDIDNKLKINFCDEQIF